MKRTIAITMTALILAFSLVGCGGRNDGNVSDTSNGTVNSSSGRYQDGLTGSNANSGSEKNGTNSSAQSGNGTNSSAQSGNSSQDTGLMNDMGDAASDIGNAIGEAGNAVGDAITGNSGTPSTGMAGGR